MKLKGRKIDFSIIFAEQTEFNNPTEEVDYYMHEKERVTKEINSIIDANNAKLAELNKQTDKLSEESKAVYNLGMRAIKKLSEMRSDTLGRQMKENKEKVLKDLKKKEK